MFQNAFLDIKTAARRNISGQPEELYSISPVKQNPSGGEPVGAVVAAPRHNQDRPVVVSGFLQVIIGSVSHRERRALHEDQRRNPDHFRSARVTGGHFGTGQYVLHYFRTPFRKIIFFSLVKRKGSLLTHKNQLE